MAADAVGGRRVGGHILLDPIAVVVAVGLEVGRVALGAGAACTAVDAGVAMAVETQPPVAVDRIVAGGARGVDCGDDVAGMAGDAGSGNGHRCVVAVLVFVEITIVSLSPFVTFAARMTNATNTAEDVFRMGTVNWVLQERRRGVAIGAAVVVDGHGGIGSMADRHAARFVQDDAEAIGGDG